MHKIFNFRKKHTIYLIGVFLLLYNSSTFCQTLILNGDFEDLQLFKGNISITDEGGSSSMYIEDTTLFWSNAEKSHIDILAKHWQYVDENAHNVVNAIYSDKGEAYQGKIFGLSTFLWQNGPRDAYSSFLVGKLCKPLIKDHKYIISFFIKAYSGNINCESVQIATIRNETPFFLELGQKQSTFPYISLNLPKKQNIYNKIETTIIAEGDEKYVCIGNLTGLIPQHKKSKYSFGHISNDNSIIGIYAIDNVVVRPLNLSDTCYEQIPTTFNTEALNNTSFDAKETVLTDIHFELNSYTLLEREIQSLDSLYIYLINNPQYCVSFLGYADSSGNESYNVKLSWMRASEVAMYIETKGINRNRISFEGKGVDKSETYILSARRVSYRVSPCLAKE